MRGTDKEDKAAAARVLGEETMSIGTELLPWIVSGVGGALCAALLLPTKLGEALIQFRTSKLLEGFKAEQNRELEKFKAEQNRQLEQLKAAQGHELERLKERLNHLEGIVADAPTKWNSTRSRQFGKVS